MSATDAQKQLKKLARRARKQGWIVEHVSSGHLRFTAPDQASYVTSSVSPRTLEGVRECERELRKEGLE